MQPMIGGFAGFGFVFLAIGSAILLVQRRFRRQSVTTQGVIIALRAHAPRSGYAGMSTLGTGMLYHPTVRFTTADGQLIEAESRVGTNPPPGRAGQAVTVRYDPTTPERFSLAASSRVASVIAWSFVLAGGLVFGISASALIAIMKP